LRLGKEPGGNGAARPDIRTPAAPENSTGAKSNTTTGAMPSIRVVAVAELQIPISSLLRDITRIMTEAE
jgi:hypothetical protein